MAEYSFLWYWKFEGELLPNIDTTSDKWSKFITWLENEEAQVLTQYPPSQLESMRQLVDQKELEHIMTLKVLDKIFETQEDYLSYLEQEWHRFQTKLYSLEDYLKMGTLFWNVSAIKVAKIKVPFNWEDNISEWA